MAAILANGTAQTNFFTKTCYRGAFAPAPATMWTDNWTEWDPQNKTYPAPTMTVNGNITSNTTWATGQTVLLSSQCFVKNNSVLTIQPGVIILGDKSISGAGLFITKGSQLIANGTATAPIVFTSNQAPGNRALGDWGGVILMGKADNNNAGGTNNIEGLPISTDTEFGGGASPDDNDNSGSLQYVRIEFGGYVYQPNKEINGLTFGAVGRGTVIDHVQVSFSNDDAYEWFGGTVNCKHLVAYRCLDDNFDTDNGYRGMVQFCLGIHDPQFADNPSVSTSEGFESDNDPNGTTATPLTAALFSNVTDIGALRGVTSATCAVGHRRGARIRRNSNLKIFNSIFMDDATRGLYIDGASTEGNVNSGGVKFKNNILAGYGQKAMETGTFGILVNPNAWLIAEGNDTLKSTNGILVNPYNYNSPDYRPAKSSLASAGASFTDAVFSSNTASISVIVMASMPGTICVDATHPATFIPSSTVSPDYCSLTWSASAGVSISNPLALNPVITITATGTYSVYLAVNTGDGLKTSVQAVTTNTCVDVGLNEHNNLDAGVTVYPNPAVDEVVIQTATCSSELKIRLTSAEGKIALEKTLLPDEGLKTSLNTACLSGGIYILSITSNEGSKRLKLIINK